MRTKYNILFDYFFKRREKFSALINMTAKRAARRFHKKSQFSPFPETVMIRITDQSNLEPTCCGKWARIGSSYGMDKIWADQLTTGQWKDFISEIASFKPYIFFEGGEPLLRDDILELIRFTSSHNLLCGIRTNGLLLKRDARAIIGGGLDYIVCNLDGPESVNAEIT